MIVKHILKLFHRNNLDKALATGEGSVWVMGASALEVGPWRLTVGKGGNRKLGSAMGR